MYCQYCGHEIHDRASICMNCGCATGNRPVSAAAPIAAAETTSTRDTTTTDVSAKNGVVALILLLMLGQFGGHRFYLNRFGSGILMGLMFIFVWVLMILGNILETINPDFGLPDELRGIAVFLLVGWCVWWIIDLILLCTGKFKDAQGRGVKL